MAKVPGTWKHDEAHIAVQMTDALQTITLDNHTCTRIPLSGSNNRRTDGTPHHGDISLPDSINTHVELKRRKSFAHQTLFETAKADAAKHGISENNTILITKALRQRGFTAIIDTDLLFRLLSLPGAREILKFDRSTDAAQSNRPSRSSTKRPSQKRAKEANENNR